MILNQDADSEPRRDIDEPAFLRIDDGEFDFDYDDFDFTGLMACFPGSISIASDDGMAGEVETPVPQAPIPEQILQPQPIQSGASSSAAAAPKIVQERAL